MCPVLPGGSQDPPSIPPGAPLCSRQAAKALENVREASLFSGGKVQVTKKSRGRISCLSLSPGGIGRGELISEGVGSLQPRVDPGQGTAWRLGWEENMKAWRGSGWLSWHRPRAGPRPPSVQSPGPQGNPGTHSRMMRASESLRVCLNGRLA